MSPQPQERYGANRRRDFRCPVPEPGQAATLRAGQVEIPVWILDESAGGFAVRANQPVNLHVDDLVELSTPAGVFEVRVAHLAEEPPAPSSDRPSEKQGALEDAEDGVPRVRLGLEHVRDVGFWVVMPHQTPWYRLMRSLRVPLPVSWDMPTMVIGIILTMCVVVPLVVVTWYGEDNANRLLRDSRPAKTPSRAVEPIAPSRSGPEPMRRHRAASPPFGPAQQGIASTIDPRKLARTIRDLAGATPFELPDVARMLSLSEAQQAAIREVVESYSRVLQEFEVLDPGMSRQDRTERRAALLEEARRKAEALLNPQQQADWAALQKAASAKEEEAKGTGKR